jgi:hypothetical protein
MLPTLSRRACAWLIHGSKNAGNAKSPKYLKTMHYHGKGVFTIAGKTINLNHQFTKWPDV